MKSYKEFILDLLLYSSITFALCLLVRALWLAFGNPYVEYWIVKGFGYLMQALGLFVVCLGFYLIWIVFSFLTEEK
jgi:hypothetical protein